MRSMRHVIFDANLRLHRWSSRADAAASANACVPGALLARLALSGFYPSAVAAALGESVRAAASSCERWGALD